jgi:hypothetical protein
MDTTEVHVIGNDRYVIKCFNNFDGYDYQVFLNGVMGFHSDEREEVIAHLAKIHPPGNFRYPTSIHWGADYAHGFKYVTADNARHAELIIFRRSNGTATRENIQIKTEDGKFRFTTPEDYNV